MSTRDDSIMDLVWALAPGKNDVVALIHSYFDETVADGTLCVSGYIFRTDKVRKFETKWRRMLLKYDLPFFRMSACNSNAPPFDKLSELQCIEVQTCALKIINEFASYGFSALVRPKDFSEAVGRDGFLQSPYELLILSCLLSVQRWAEMDGRVGGISYFFEAGFADEKKGSRLMNEMFCKSPELKAFFKYRSHAFVTKEYSMPTQAADTLAWHKGKHLKREAAGVKGFRKDFDMLLKGTPTQSVSIEKVQLKKVVSGLEKQFGPDANRLTGLAFREPQKLRRILFNRITGAGKNNP